MREPGEDELDLRMGELAQGERAAFDALFRALYPRALRFARARVGPDRACDAAQEALARVFARAGEFTPGRPVLPWFYAILANEIRALSRQRDPELERAARLAVEGWAAGPEDPERALLEGELNDALERAIRALDGPSAGAIAALLGRSVRPEIADPAFRKRVSRAVARLRLLLGGSDGT